MTLGQGQLGPHPQNGPINRRHHICVNLNNNLPDFGLYRFTSMKNEFKVVGGAKVDGVVIMERAIWEEFSVSLCSDHPY